MAAQKEGILGMALPGLVAGKKVRVSNHDEKRFGAKNRSSVSVMKL
jgi:hypothetical protein